VALGLNPVRLLQVVTQQVLPIVVAVGGAEHGVHVERGRGVVVEEHAGVVVQFHDHHGALDPEVEGVPDVCLSLPSLVNARGAQVMAYPLLNETEKGGLERSARVIKSASDGILKG